MKTSDDRNAVWIFNGNGGRFPAAVFSTRDLAEEWINANGVEGVLTRYPVDVSAYDWCVDKGYFEPKAEDQKQAAFIQKFSSAYQEHYHYEDSGEA